jgi:hypothetical protein
MKQVFVLFGIILIVLPLIIEADIECNADGICSGWGAAGNDVSCSGCHSCTYKVGCNCLKSYIPNFRAAAIVVLQM